MIMYRQYTYIYIYVYIYISLRHSMRPFRTPPKRLPAAVPFPPRRRCQRLEILQACTGWQFQLLQEKARLHLRPKSQGLRPYKAKGWENEVEGRATQKNSMVKKTIDTCLELQPKSINGKNKLQGYATAHHLSTWFGHVASSKTGSGFVSKDKDHLCGTPCVPSARRPRDFLQLCLFHHEEGARGYRDFASMHWLAIPIVTGKSQVASEAHHSKPWLRLLVDAAAWIQRALGFIRLYLKDKQDNGY